MRIKPGRRRPAETDLFPLMLIFQQKRGWGESEPALQIFSLPIPQGDPDGFFAAQVFLLCAFAIGESHQASTCLVTDPTHLCATNPRRPLKNNFGGPKIQPFEDLVFVTGCDGFRPCDSFSAR